MEGEEGRLMRREIDEVLTDVGLGSLGSPSEAKGRHLLREINDDIGWVESFMYILKGSTRDREPLSGRIIEENSIIIV
jgi:hypothetical protein